MRDAGAISAPLPRYWARTRAGAPSNRRYRLARYVLTRNSSGVGGAEKRDGPYRYRLHLAHEIIAPSICLVYGKRQYPESAISRPEHIQAVLNRFKTLRFGDSSIYLRPGSINVMNGIVGLSFSTDDTSYLPVEDFLHIDWPLPHSADRIGVYVREVPRSMPGRCP
ncbi:MAG: hypothetical protein OES09_07785 [Gammaproteobacteria bacterium]|nr:hypothetical protein [Gammaproteobacteria bacterium]